MISYHLSALVAAIAFFAGAGLFLWYRHATLGRLATVFNRTAAQLEYRTHVLEREVLDRSAQLEAANEGLEAFALSVDRDVRSIDALSQSLLDAGAKGDG